MNDSTADIIFQAQSYIQFAFGLFILAANSIILFTFIKYKNDNWTFISHGTLEYLIYNQLFAISCLTSILPAYPRLDTLYTCLVPLSFREFIILSTFKINLSFALARLYQIKNSTCFSPKPAFYCLEKLFVPLLVLVFTLSPVFFGWNNYNDPVRCLYKRVMPPSFIVTINSLVVGLAAATIGIYAYIYAFCKRKMSNVGDLSRRESCGGSGGEAKLKVLRFQIGIFVLLFLLSLPNLLVSYYEAITRRKVKYFSTIFNWWMLVDYLTRPVIYTYRLTFMKRLYGRESEIPI